MRVCMARGRFPLAQTAPEKYLQTRAKRRRSGNAEAPDTLLDDGRCYRLTHRRTENGGLIVVFTEFSDRQKREIALHRSHLRFQAYLDALTVGIEEVDLDGRITFCNPVFSHCLGYETGELIGKLQSDIMQTPWVEVAKKQMTPKKAVLRRSQQSRRVSAQYFTRPRAHTSQPPSTGASSVTRMARRAVTSASSCRPKRLLARPPIIASRVTSTATLAHSSEVSGGAHDDA